MDVSKKLEEQWLKSEAGLFFKAAAEHGRGEFHTYAANRTKMQDILAETITIRATQSRAAIAGGMGDLITGITKIGACTMGIPALPIIALADMATIGYLTMMLGILEEDWKEHEANKAAATDGMEDSQ